MEETPDNQFTPVVLLRTHGSAATSVKLLWRAVLKKAVSIIAEDTQSVELHPCPFEWAGARFQRPHFQQAHDQKVFFFPLRCLRSSTRPTLQGFPPSVLQAWLVMGLIFYYIYNTLLNVGCYAICVSSLFINSGILYSQKI